MVYLFSLISLIILGLHFYWFFYKSTINKIEKTNNFITNLNKSKPHKLSVSIKKSKNGISEISSIKAELFLVDSIIIIVPKKNLWNILLNFYTFPAAFFCSSNLGNHKSSLENNEFPIKIYEIDDIIYLEKTRDGIDKFKISYEEKLSFKELLNPLNTIRASMTDIKLEIQSLKIIDNNKLKILKELG